MPQKPWRHSLKRTRSLTVLTGLLIVFLGRHSLLGNNSDEAATPITQLDIPLTITQPGRYVVTEHLSMAGGVAISIRADDVHLNLNGFSLSGPLRSADQCLTGHLGFGILVAAPLDDPLEGVHITNGTVQGFSEGITLSSVKVGRLSGLTVTATCFSGIRLGSATDFDVSSNNVSSNFGWGVLLVRADHNRLKRNIVNGNAVLSPEDGDYDYAGYLLISSHGNVIAANDISGNGIDTLRGHGVTLMGSHNNTIHRNRLHRNTGQGIQLRLGPFPSITGSSGNTVHNNIVSASGFNGIFLDGYSGRNLIQANQTYENRIGIAAALVSTSFEPVDGNTFKLNTALGNITDLADFGSPVVQCPNIWKNNTFVTKANTIYGFNCIQ